MAVAVGYRLLSVLVVDVEADAGVAGAGAGPPVPLTRYLIVVQGAKHDVVLVHAHHVGALGTSTPMTRR